MHGEEEDVQNRVAQTPPGLVNPAEPSKPNVTAKASWPSYLVPVAQSFMPTFLQGEVRMDMQKLTYTR